VGQVSPPLNALGRVLNSDVLGWRNIRQPKFEIGKQSSDAKNTGK
jgi:hypothetical protein